MKRYPTTSTLTIGARLEQLIAHRPKTAKDVWVNVYDNSTEYSPEDFGFYLSDYEEFKDMAPLKYRLDSVTRSEGVLNLGFTHFNER